MSKIVTTNFSAQPLYDLGKLRLHLALVILVLLISVLFLTSNIYKMNGELVKERKIKEVLEYEYTVVQRAAESMPDYSTLKEIERKAGVIREISNTKGNTSVRVLGTIEKILQKNAVLTSFYHRSKVGEIDITIQANDTLALTAFVHELEESDDFKQVLITRQSHEEQESDTFAYDIRIIQDDGK